MSFSEVPHPKQISGISIQLKPEKVRNDEEKNKQTVNL
jgi:hypothetical protein